MVPWTATELQGREKGAEIKERCEKEKERESDGGRHLQSWRAARTPYNYLHPLCQPQPTVWSETTKGEPGQKGEILTFDSHANSQIKNEYASQTRMQTPTNWQNVHNLIAGTPLTHSHTHGLIMALRPDCVQCGSTLTVYFKGLQANSRFPSLFLSSTLSFISAHLTGKRGGCEGIKRSYGKLIH